MTNAFRFFNILLLSSIQFLYSISSMCKSNNRQQETVPFVPPPRARGLARASIDAAAMIKSKNWPAISVTYQSCKL